MQIGILLFLENEEPLLLLQATKDGFLAAPLIDSKSNDELTISPSDFVATVGVIDKPMRVNLDNLRTCSSLELTNLIPSARLHSKVLARILKAFIAGLTRTYSQISHQAQLPAESLQELIPFEPGKTTIPYAGRVFDADEVEAAVRSTLDFWLTLGPEGAAFEKELAGYLGVNHTLLVNSGSSANLVAFTALTSHKLPAARRIVPGDEVITCAAGFPTTVAPIVQNGAIPVFIDNVPSTGNAVVSQLEAAFQPGKTKAVMVAHTLGNPFDIAAVLAFCRKHDLWLIEDNCDALGSTYSMPLSVAQELHVGHLIKIAEAGAHRLIRIEEQNGHTVLTAPTGTWGDLSTQSFYPPHHLTMGEGGAVNIISRPPLKAYAESFRDWGRDCWCASGKDNTCNKRFGWQLGELPEGYDHKYIYSHMGYNLKPLDPQAAIGRQQLKKLDGFVRARRENWEKLRRGLADLEEYIEFSLPTHATAWSEKTGFAWDATGCTANPSWFGFMVRLRPGIRSNFTPRGLGQFLDQNKIGNRLLFGGNLLRQPVFVQLKKDRPESFRVVGALEGADEIMNTALFLGTYPGLTDAMIQYQIEKIHEFVKQ